MCSKNGVVYKLHAGWFINRAPGEFINCGPFIKFKGPLSGHRTERGKVSNQISDCKELSRNSGENQKIQVNSQ